MLLPACGEERLIFLLIFLLMISLITGAVPASTCGSETAIGNHQFSELRTGVRINMEPVVLKRDQHPISRKNIGKNALKVLYRLKKNGFMAYLVGGTVRDLLLGRNPKDFDITTDARPRQIKRMFRNCVLIGRRFRLAHIRFYNEIIEVSTFRRNADTGNDRAENAKLITHDNIYGTPEEDAHRRDFTINGLFYNIDDFSVIDYVNGLEDLEKGKVCSIGEPEVRFIEDPVRMIRAVRVAGRLDFEIEQATLKAILKLKSNIQKASTARLLEEIAVLFRWNSAVSSLELMRKTGLSGELLPELDEICELIEKNGLDPKRCFWNYISVLDELPLHWKESQTFIFAVLLMPLIKLKIDTTIPKVTQQRIKELAEKIVFDFHERRGLPKKVRDGIIDVILAQTKLYRIFEKKFNPRSVMKRAYFEDALRLFEVFVRGDDKGWSFLRRWNALVKQRSKRSKQSRRRRLSKKKSRR